MSAISTVNVDLGERAYRIEIGRGWIAGLPAAIKSSFPSHRVALVTNEPLRAFWGEKVAEALRAGGVEADLLALPEGEEAKTLDTVSRIYDFLIERKYGRQTALLALGGGVVGDVVGFAAASFLRGVALVQIPTSLLAMVDSSVGGKTGVNHRLGKNLIGAFKQPNLVGIDLDFLSTLPIEEFRSGLAEVVKYGMISDAGLFEDLEEGSAKLTASNHEMLGRVVTRSCEIKAAVVVEDEVEGGVRAILNFGHTFAHAAETLTNYKGVRHGEAVAMGMMAACRLGEIVQGFPAGSTHRLERLLKAVGLPVALPRFPVERYIDVMRSDKKVRSGKMRFIVPTTIGEVAIRDDIEDSAVARVLEASFAPGG